MRQYKGVKSHRRKSHERNSVYYHTLPKHDYMKFYRVVRYWAKDMYNLGTADIDMLFFLHGEGIFAKYDFEEFSQLCGWDKYRFQKMMKDKWIATWRHAKKGEATLYKITFKGKRVVDTMYKMLDGSIINERAPMFRKNVKYNDKVYRNYMRKINQDIQLKRRLGTE